MLCASMNNGAPQQFQSYNQQPNMTSISPPAAVPSYPPFEAGKSEKRGRGQEGGIYQQCQQKQQGYVQLDRDAWQPKSVEYGAPPSQSPSKRSRSNRYEAPRTVRPSILTAIGSLVGGSHGHGGPLGNPAGHGSNLVTVPLRRQLSGGALDQFIGGHDTMDMETSDNNSRPRSMSF